MTDLDRYIPERDEAGYLDAKAAQRDRKRVPFLADNRRSVRMQAILSTRKRPVNRRKRGAK